MKTTTYVALNVAVLIDHASYPYQVRKVTLANIDAGLSGPLRCPFILR